MGVRKREKLERERVRQNQREGEVARREIEWEGEEKRRNEAEEGVMIEEIEKSVEMGAKESREREWERSI